MKPARRGTRLPVLRAANGHTRSGAGRAGTEGGGPGAARPAWAEAGGLVGKPKGARRAPRAEGKRERGSVSKKIRAPHADWVGLGSPQARLPAAWCADSPLSVPTAGLQRWVSSTCAPLGAPKCKGKSKSQKLRFRDRCCILRVAGSAPSWGLGLKELREGREGTDSSERGFQRDLQVG